MRKIFLNTPSDITVRIGYVRDNLTWAGLPEQNWESVTDYER